MTKNRGVPLGQCLGSVPWDSSPRLGTLGTGGTAGRRDEERPGEQPICHDNPWHLPFLLIPRRQRMAYEALDRLFDSVWVVAAFFFQKTSVNEGINFRFV